MKSSNFTETPFTRRTSYTLAACHLGPRASRLWFRLVSVNRYRVAELTEDGIMSAIDFRMGIGGKWMRRVIG
jgi:hypothetical protein